LLYPRCNPLRESATVMAVALFVWTVRGMFLSLMLFDLEVVHQKNPQILLLAHCPQEKKDALAV
jgi:hypothetical protein